MNVKKLFFRLGKEALNNIRYIKNQTARKFVKEHRCAALTKEEKAEIDRYWANYNVKFKNYDWFRMFYHVTGMHVPQFIPQPFLHTVLYPHYRNLQFSPAYADKSMFPFFEPELQFPTVFGKRIFNRYYDADDQYCGDEINDLFIDSVWERFKNHNGGKETEIILKFSDNSSRGKGVKKFSVLSKEDLKKVLRENQQEDYILQEVIRQHPFFQQLNQDSVNIIRITTWRKENEVFCLSPCVRFGIKGSHTDISFRNGKEIMNAIRIDPDGKISDKYVTLEGEHLDLPAGIDRQIPQWDNIVAAVKVGAMRLKYFDIVAWDITVDEQGRVICIEYNLRYPGTQVYQFAHGPLAGEHTDELLSFLKDPENKKLIPLCIRKH